jgi:hypothetical protein
MRRENTSSHLLNGKTFSACSSSKIRKKKSCLTLEQRYKIQVLKEEGLNQTQIAERGGRNKSVTCRE